MNVIVDTTLILMLKEKKYVFKKSWPELMVIQQLPNFSSGSEKYRG